MNNEFDIFKKLLIILIIISILSLDFIQFQNIFASSIEDKYITNIEVDILADKFLSNFYLEQKRVLWNFGRRYIFYSEKTQERVSIQIGIYSSAKDAETVATNYLNSMSMIMTSGDSSINRVGNKCWWMPANSPDKTNIIFLRENVLFIIFSHNKKNLLGLANSIDEDITSGEDYIDIKNSISVPSIKSISLEKKSLKIGEASKITVSAIDEKIETLEYQFYPGVNRHINDPENVFTFKLTRNKFEKRCRDKYILKVIIINEKNIVSPISKIMIDCLE